MAAPTSVEEYLAGLPEDSRAALQRLRETIKAAAPEATETISYQMPTFKEHGRFLVSYAAFKDHCSLYPCTDGMMKACGDEIGPRRTGKGTIRFTPDDPLPPELVSKIVKVRLGEITGERP